MTAVPIALAFSAGMVATLNPCGFAMLPAYVSYLLGAQREGFKEAGAGERALKGLGLGFVVTLGFLLVFLGLGAVLSLGGRAVMAYVPWAALLIGVAMVGLGLYLLAGRELHVRGLPGVRSRPGTGWRAIFLFGVAYAVASLSCTLPIFLVVVGAALAAGGVLPGLVAFGAYGAGMGLVLTAVSLGAALFQGAVARYLRTLLPHMSRLSALVLILAGGYLVYYQLTYSVLR